MRKWWMIAAVIVAVAALAAACWLNRSEPCATQGTSTGLGLMLLEKEAGLYVLAVTDGSPADRADIHPGDYLLRAGDASLKTTAQLDEVIESGVHTLELRLHRGQQELTILLPVK